MEEKVHYPVALHKENGEKNENYQQIPLERVVLDPGMEFMGKQKCHKLLLEKRIKTLNNGVETKLYKWDKVEADFDSGKEMDPVKLKRFKKTEFFTVLDGRHRCMVSFSKGYTHVPANLYEEF
jgi:hypothetical protein